MTEQLHHGDRLYRFERIETVVDEDHYAMPPVGVLRLHESSDIDEKPWCLTFACPCGCGLLTFVNLTLDGAPRWILARNDDGTLTIMPSVQRIGGCGSHFFVDHNNVRWC